MKTTAFALALLAGTAAIAGPNHSKHDAAATTAAAEATLDESAAVSSDPAIDTAASDAAAPADQSLTSTVATDPAAPAPASTTLASTTPASGSVVQPSNENPERDARGIKVISAEAMVPAGFNGVTSPVAEGGPELDPATGEPAASDSYPACSRTVTDNCLQEYERGRDA